MRAAVWAWLAGLGLLLHALHGCTSAPPPPAVPASAPVPASVFVLLPDDSGLTGQITVSNSGGTRELTRAGEAVRISALASAPSAPFVMSSDEVTRVLGAAIAAQPGPPARFLLYFEGDSDTLTPESRVHLGEVVRSVVERRAIDVSIIGHTDTVGSRAYNFRLGLRRAVRVQEAIRQLPIDQSILRVDSHGKDAPLVQTGDNVPEPRNRRVEVTVR
jgi:outer membrane protein OmpA-like peptidoglycan-associated protein